MSLNPLLYFNLYFIQILLIKYYILYIKDNLVSWMSKLRFLHPVQSDIGIGPLVEVEATKRQQPGIICQIKCLALGHQGHLPIIWSDFYLQHSSSMTGGGGGGRVVVVVVGAGVVLVVVVEVVVVGTVVVVVGTVVVVVGTVVVVGGLVLISLCVHTVCNI